MFTLRLSSIWCATTEGPRWDFSVLEGHLKSVRFPPDRGGQLTFSGKLLHFHKGLLFFLCASDMWLSGHYTWQCPWKGMLPEFGTALGSCCQGWHLILIVPPSMGLTYHLKTLDPEPGGCTKEYLFVIGDTPLEPQQWCGDTPLLEPKQGWCSKMLKTRKQLVLQQVPHAGEWNFVLPACRLGVCHVLHWWQQFWSTTTRSSKSLFLS